MRNILRLSAGDLLARTLYFFAFVHMARTLGVFAYGVLEFAVSVRTYFLLMADIGLELWAVREAAKVQDVRQLVARVVPLRLLLAAGTFALVAVSCLYAVGSDHGDLSTLLLLFGLTLFTQAFNLKWVFMGQEKTARVATGLILTQIVFSVLIFALVNSPGRVTWVPVLWLAGELPAVIYYWRLLAATHPGPPIRMTLRQSAAMLKPALTIGASQALALVSYNLDSLMLGVMRGAIAVGRYNAAYKPVTALLSLPLSYFYGLFPALSRTFTTDMRAYRTMVLRSFRLTAIFALPVGVGGTLLAEPVIQILFGPAYQSSVYALQILSWSAVLVILRGTFRQALNAAHEQKLDLICAGCAAIVNVGCNAVLIPKYGVTGTGWATVASELVWFILITRLFSAKVTRISVLPLLLWPCIAAGAMAVFMTAAQPLFWIIRGMLGLVVYLAVLLAAEPDLFAELRSWIAVAPGLRNLVAARARAK